MQTHQGALSTAGEVALRVIRADENEWEPIAKPTLSQITHLGAPRKDLNDDVNEWRKTNAPHLWRGMRQVLAAKALKVPIVFGSVFHTVIRADGRRIPLGLASMRVVTTAGVGFVVDAFQNLVELEAMNFHGIGTGATAEAVGDTALVTELTTEYNPDNTRATGAQSEAAANIYRTVGTNTVDAAAGIQEHGVFDQAATGGGVLLDRSVFAVVNLGIGDSLESTYDFTVTAGG